MLGRLGQGGPAERRGPDIAALDGFLVRQRPEGIIDLVSYLYARRLADAAGAPDPQAGDAAASQPRLAECVALLESHRGGDGGYGKAPGASISSTYHTFLAWQCYEMLGAPPANPELVGPFVRGRRRDDGGFVDLARMYAASVNPTAAGAALAVASGQADEAMLLGAIQFLLRAQCPDGGWSASPRVPAGDLLSSFTALLTLWDLGALPQANLRAAARFVAQCRRDGPYAGSPRDEQADVEYAFYGLGCRAILAGQE